MMMAMTDPRAFLVQLYEAAVQRALQAEPAVLEKSADLQSAATACERIQSANTALRQPR